MKKGCTCILTQPQGDYNTTDNQSVTKASFNINKSKQTIDKK